MNHPDEDPERDPARIVPAVAIGDKVEFRDRKGRIIIGRVLDEDRLMVEEGSVVGKGTILYKHPYMTWEDCTKVRNGATRLLPRDLIAFTRYFMDDWDPDGGGSRDDSPFPMAG